MVMATPVVAILGRPNVGKSTLFNRILRSRVAIVEDFPGVTRDRLYREVSWDDRRFILVDTGGLFAETDDPINVATRRQSLFAAEEADIIILLFDGKEGLTPLDREIVDLLRDLKKPIIYVVNKIDSPEKESHMLEFYELGIDELLPLSAAGGYGFSDLMERVISLLPGEAEERKEDQVPRIAIVGRPNVGKSTLVNALLSKERMIVSPIPGTTRDSVDSLCSYYRRHYLLIDTAGLRRKSRIAYPVERFMSLRAINSIERADVVLLMVDAREGITEQDQKIASLVDRYGKGLIILFNKWDLVENPDERYRQLQREMSWKLHFVGYAPFLTISANTRKRATKVFPLIDEIMEERRRRIPTSELNRFIREIEPSLPAYRGRKTKIYYITQTGVEPPQFVFFPNRPESFKPETIRYIERLIRARYPFKGTPVRIYVRKRNRE